MGPPGPLNHKGPAGAGGGLKPSEACRGNKVVAKKSWQPTRWMLMLQITIMMGIEGGEEGRRGAEGRTDPQRAERTHRGPEGRNHLC